MNEDSVISSQDLVEFFRLIYLPPPDPSNNLYCLFEEKREVDEGFIQEFVDTVMRKVAGGKSGISFEQFEQVKRYIYVYI